jgi:hypothetical protein
LKAVALIERKLEIGKYKSKMVEISSHDSVAGVVPEGETTMT